MAKKLEESTITNELKGASGFFQPQTANHDSAVKVDRIESASTLSGTDRSKRTGVANGRQTRPAGQTERPDRTVGSSAPSRSPSVVNELTDGVAEENRRPTERYAFEVFSDQKQAIVEIQGRYQVKTGKKLAASRIIRDALDAYLDKLKTML